MEGSVYKVIEVVGTSKTCGRRGKSPWRRRKEPRRLRIAEVVNRM